MVARASRQRASMDTHTQRSDLLFLKRGVLGDESGDVGRQALEWELSSTQGAVKVFVFKLEYNCFTMLC